MLRSTAARDTASLPTAPEAGQLVEVRNRQFVVLEVVKSALPEDPLRQGSMLRDAAQHFVRLSSVEEDGLGEELTVVWEIEPGARLHERLALPDATGSFDDPRRLEAFLCAVRWGAVSSADSRVLQAPFRSGIAIEDYQLDPLVRALQMPRVSLLVADDVGLGKTIEAGLVAQELILRHRVRSVLIVCPASLQIQWRDQMRDKFGLEFRIVDAELMRELRRSRGLRVNPWTHFPRLITSIDFLKRERPLRLLREVLPAPGEPIYPRRFDLLIVDEAHNAAPSGTGYYATDSDRTAAIRQLAPHFEHKLFLTATPHNGYPESFTALLELVDHQRFARGVPPDPVQKGLVMVRRMKSEIRNWDNSPRFPERRLEALEVSFSREERAAHADLQRYAEIRQARDRSGESRFAGEFVLKLLKKRMFSSPAAFLATLEQHEKTLGKASRGERRRPTPSLLQLRRELPRADDDGFDDDENEQQRDDAVAIASSALPDLSAEEHDILARLREFGRQASARPDSKARTLLRWLESTLRPDGDWNDTRVILFTEYRATQKWLQGILAAEGLASGGRLAVLYGGMDREEREAVKAAFQAHPRESEVRILLATDAASEGIDLQNHCSRLVHYEIPWNPNRLEQRNGRIDRHGQRASAVLVYHFVGAGYAERATRGVDGDPGATPGDLEGDLEFLMRAALKVDAIREDLGKVGPVIADQVEEAMLGRRRKLDTARAEEQARPVREMLRFERKLRDDIQRFRERIDESRRELDVSPETIRRVVDVGLALAEQPRLDEATLDGVWPDPTGERRSCPVFRMPALQGSWAECVQGVEHPHTREIRPITFDHDVASGRDDVVLVHLNHRLVQMCLRLLRAEAWAHEGRRRIHRVAARVVPDEALAEPAVVVHGRIVVLGGDNQRLHEEVVVAGGHLRDGRFSRMTAARADATLDVALVERAPRALEERLAKLWAKVRDQALAALEARMKDRATALDRLLEARAAEEAEKLGAVLRELERSIRAQLDAEPPRQLELWSDAERDQLERNRASLEARLAAIPGEIEAESAAIHRRFASPSPRLFPVAVTFLVPRHEARRG